jgi:hypothetical protein
VTPGCSTLDGGNLKRLQAAEHNQKKEFDDFLANFSAE